MKPAASDPLDPKARERLIEAAIAARERAYAPYSRFFVGAALWFPDGDLVVGCNIENASYSVTLCAERVAASAAIAGGRNDWTAVAVASTGGVSPCGACRQFLVEFSPRAIVIRINVDLEKGDPSRIRETTLDRLLPDSFDASSLSG